MSNIGPNIFWPLVNSYLPEPQASLFMGILLGVPLKGTKEIFRVMKIVGLTHLIVLSGSNITILSEMITTITKKIGKKISSVITVLTICFFVLFVGPQAPIIRAAFMSVLTLVANISGKKSISLYLLICSFIIIAIIWPLWVTTISLQLSYGATLGIILFGNSKTVKKRKITFWGNVLNYISEELRLSIAAQIFTVPIIFIYFRQISTIAPISNILVSWSIAPLMFCGILSLMLGSIYWPLGFLPALVCYGLLTYIIQTMKIISSLPYIFLSF